MEHALTLFYRDISTLTVSATRSGLSLSRTSSSSWTTRTLSRPSESRLLRARVRRRRSERCVRETTVSCEGEYRCIVQGRVPGRTQHGLERLRTWMLRRVKFDVANAGWKRQASVRHNVHKQQLQASPSDQGTALLGKAPSSSLFTR